MAASPAFSRLPALLLFAVEPTDRALAGWCALPGGMRSRREALSYVQDFNGGLYGDSRSCLDREDRLSG